MSEIKPDIRTGLGRVAQFVLGLDGVMHALEVVAAVAEKAWFTATLVGIHATFFFIGVYFIGHDQTHHHHGGEGEGTSMKGKVILFLLCLLLILAFTPLGGAVEELLHAGHDH